MNSEKRKNTIVQTWIKTAAPNFMIGAVVALFFWSGGLRAQEIRATETDSIVSFQNRHILLKFNLTDGLYQLMNSTGDTIVDNAFFQGGGLQSKDDCESRSWTVTDTEDELGSGKTLTIRVAFKNYADLIWQSVLYADQDFIVFRMGVVNDTENPYQLRLFYPLSSRRLYPGKNHHENYRILDGNSGGSPTWVTDTNLLGTFNNALVKFGSPQKPNILAAGGITYHEFEKFVRVHRTRHELHLQLYSEDPIGKKIDPRQEYLPDERFYLCFNNENPFEALEKYGNVFRKAQKIELNYYDFPTECLWYANVYSKDKKRRKFNDSRGAVEEMDNAIASGVTKFTKVGVRLVPDHYGPNNQQGWWDDEHWAMWGDKSSTEGGNYIAPYLTTESWAKAVIERGGFPFTYIQSGRRSEDFVKQHPEWMLFNDPYKAFGAPQRLYQELSYPSEYTELYSKHFWSDKLLWSYDFTDSGFVRHVRDVYKRLKKAGIKGVFYDYPELTAWAFEGGFDDPYATTASAYRNMFRLADEGLGKEAMLQERNIVRGSDIALGLIESQRVWADANKILPEMISRCGLRWYKNRVVINYDMDSKDPAICTPMYNEDGSRSMFTMSYVTSGRFLLAPSFKQLTAGQMYDLTRTFPYHEVPRSARPIDAFNEGVRFPRVYDFAVDPDWHQLTFYNYNLDSSDHEAGRIGVSLDGNLNEGGLGLNSARHYYVYDFWNDRFVGLIAGNEKLEQHVRPGEARMMSLHAKKDHPQFISTNRHLMQGFVDLRGVRWDDRSKILSGVSAVVEGDAYTIIIATNGFKPRKANVRGARVTLTELENVGLIRLTIESVNSGDIAWSVQFR